MAAEDRATTETAAATAPRRRRRMLLVTAIALVIVLAAELGTRAISSHLFPPEWAAGEVAYKHDQLTRAPADVRTVFLGDSMIDAGVDPAAFRDRAPRTGPGYNAALLGAPLAAQQLWADRIVLDQLSPDLVVLGVSPTAVSTLGVGSRDRLTYGEVISQNVRSLGDDGWARLADDVGEQVYLVRYRTSLRNPRLVASATWDTLTGKGGLDASLRPPSFWPANTSPLGQVTAYRGGQAAPTGPAGLIDNIRALLAADTVMAPLDDAVATVRSHGASLVLVVPPTALDVMAASGIDVDQWRAAVRTLADRARELDVAFVDFTDAGYDRSQFFDPFHLNGAGSDRFSRELGAAVDGLCDRDPRVRCHG